MPQRPGVSLHRLSMPIHTGLRIQRTFGHLYERTSEMNRFEKEAVFVFSCLYSRQHRSDLLSAVTGGAMMFPAPARIATARNRKRSMHQAVLRIVYDRSHRRVARCYQSQEGRVYGKIGPGSLLQGARIVLHPVSHWQYDTYTR